jgi:hypothetical protein
MIALLCGAILFASCQKDTSVENLNSNNSLMEIPMYSEDGTIGASAVTRTGILLDNAFEGSPFTGFSLSGHQYCCDYSITHVAAPDGVGKALKYDLRSSDAIVSGSKRAEIEIASGGNVGENAERWYGLRYWLQKYDTDGGAESILQWHDVDKTTPPLGIQVLNGRLRVTQSFTSGNTHTDLGAVATGKWINIVLHVKWATGNTGVLEVWRDGVKMVSKTNVRTQSKGGSYMKVGINKWSWAPGGGSSSATQRIFYIDQFRMGSQASNYESVAPDGSATTPPPTTPPPTTPPPTDKPNALPVVSAGPAQTIKLPQTTITLKGTASDPDGTIASYYWSKVSGGSAWSNNITQPTINISELTAGTYIFNLRVKDNSGASASSNVTVTVTR